jgi:cadmium resistance protein CadD (predicted permease)
VLEPIAIAAVAFVSTNIDDAFVLLGLFSDPKMRPVAIVAGQYLGFAALVLAALICAALALAIPVRYIGYLGVLPVLIGAKHLFELTRAEAASTAAPAKPARGMVGTTLSVATVTIANGGDNIAVYVPLFSRQPVDVVLAICAVFAALLALWCLAAGALVGHPQLGAPFRRWGRRVTPFVLIALGCYILIASGAIAV